MIKKILITIVLLISVSFVGFPQSSSSYTRLSIGDPVYNYSGRRLGMGQLGTSVADKDFINTLNPAGWSRLTRTRVEFGLSYNGLFISDKSSEFYTGEMEFNGFTIAFPVSTVYGIGVAAGIVPFSNVSYKVTESVTGITNYDIEYEGRGGLSKVFLGSSYTLPFNLTIGATLDYYFGNLNYFSRVNFQGDNNFDSEYKRTYSPYGIGSTVGVISPDFSSLLGTESIQDLRLGFAANIISSMNTDTLLESSSTLYSDTLGSGIVSLKVPIRFSAGLSFVFNRNYLFLFDFMHQGMQDYRFNNQIDRNLRNATKLSAGFEYKPDFQPGDSFLEQIILRAGVSYEELPYIINGNGINEYSVSGGFSIPLTTENTLDIGIQYASRGSKENGLIKEDRIRLNLGISLGDIWFVRQDK
jgi:hypothetical protein